ncbi:hypothetical protein D9M73_210800 [compost metagenome]
MQFLQALAQRAQGHLDQVQACRLHRTPLQDPAGDHRQQATVTADQGQFQAVHALIGRRVGEQVLQGAHRLGGVDLLDWLFGQVVGVVAQLIADAGGHRQQVAVSRNRAGQRHPSFTQ